MIDLVVARYKEDVYWTQSPDFEKFNVIVYDKSGQETPYTAIPNPGGNEAHTYLWHMSYHYDTLADYTAFVQGNPFDHISYERLVWELNNPEPQEFTWLAGEIYECDWQGLPHHPGLPLAQIYAAATGRISPPNFRFGVGGQFMVHKSLIRNKPIYHYQRNLQTVANGFTPHPVWCGYERIWDQLFT